MDTDRNTIEENTLCGSSRSGDELENTLIEASLNGDKLECKPITCSVSAELESSVSTDDALVSEINRECIGGWYL